MPRKTKQINLNSQFKITELITSIFTMLLLIVFVGQNAITFLDFNTKLSQGKDVENRDQFFSFDFSDIFHSYSHAPFNPDPCEPCPLSESELEDSLDDDLKDWIGLTSFIEKLKQSNDNASTSSFTLLLNNRKVIPLFILHHSWRAFLS